MNQLGKSTIWLEVLWRIQGKIDISSLYFFSVCLPVPLSSVFSIQAMSNLEVMWRLISFFRAFAVEMRMDRVSYLVRICFKGKLMPTLPKQEALKQAIQPFKKICHSSILQSPNGSLRWKLSWFTFNFLSWPAQIYIHQQRRITWKEAQETPILGNSSAFYAIRWCNLVCHPNFLREEAIKEGSPSRISGIRLMTSLLKNMVISGDTPNPLIWKMAAINCILAQVCLCDSLRAYNMSHPMWVSAMISRLEIVILLLEQNDPPNDESLESQVFIISLPAAHEKTKPRPSLCLLSR